ncbi:MAG: hypothetical protein WBA28_04985 [Microbacteriaceae bacterium]
MKTFRVENYKGIRGTIEVSSDGGSIIVQGKNGAGKSSFIDGIAELFDAKGFRLTPEPIFDGGNYAKAELEDTSLDLRIEREWKRTEKGDVKSTLSVYNLTDGAKHQKPSEIVAQITGGLIFDPSEFLLAEPKDQTNLLLTKVEFTDKKFNFLHNEQLLTKAEEERREAFQIKQAALGAVENAEKPAPDTPDQPVSTQELVEHLTAARAQNQAHGNLEQEQAQNVSRINELDQRVKDLQAQLAQAEKNLAEARNAHVRIEETLKSSPGIIDTTNLEQQIANVDEINRDVQIKRTLDKLREDAQVKVEHWEYTVSEVGRITKVKKDALATAIFPDPNLSITEVSEGFDQKTGVEKFKNIMMYGAVPFTQVNTASQRKAAFSIATAGNPDLKLVIVKEGDLLDDESLAQLDAVAVERGFDVLIERGRQDVGDLVATFIEMEDGQAK